MPQKNESFDHHLTTVSSSFRPSMFVGTGKKKPETKNLDRPFRSSTVKLSKNKPTKRINRRNMYLIGSQNSSRKPRRKLDPTLQKKNNEQLPLGTPQHG
jgi:hypothetical protein